MLHKSRSLEYRGLEISNNLARLPVATYFSLKPASTARCRAYPSAASPALLVLIFPGLCPATACLGSSEQFARKHRIYPAASRTGLYHPLKASPEIVHLLLRFTVHHKSDSRREFCIMARRSTPQNADRPVGTSRSSRYPWDPGRLRRSVRPSPF
jgi:hypothetical protein